MKDTRHTRRGSTYLLVLISTALVVAIGLSGLLATRVRARISQAQIDAAEARSLARSAIEIGLLRVTTDPDWRSTWGSGPWISDRPLGEGTLSLEVEDPDGSIGDDPSDPFVLTGIGEQGDARQMSDVTVTPQPVGLECLLHAAHCEGTLAFNGVDVNADAPLSSNTGAIASAANVYADVEASGTVLGLFYWGGVTQGAPDRPLPDPGVIDAYAADAVAIDYEELEEGKMSEVLLSPASNPFGSGSTHPLGLYVIDCENDVIEIEDSRIVGTLILRNVAAGSRIRRTVNVGPAVANYPVLLVDGPFKIDLDSLDLDENQVDMNFNPPGTPYEGSEDNDTNDTYPTLIKGLVYVTGKVTLLRDTQIEGVVLGAGGIEMKDQIELVHDPVFYESPPPGFIGSWEYLIQSGSWAAAMD